LELLTCLNRLLSFKCIRCACPLFSSTFGVDQVPSAILLTSRGCLVYKGHVDFLSSLASLINLNWSDDEARPFVVFGT
jgi:hypothetical protein